MYFKMRPPEAYTTSTFTVAFDIYQFGLTLYRMCNGNAAFNQQFSHFGATPDAFDRDAFKFAVRNGRFPDRAAFPEHIPERVRKVIKRCLEPAPQDRFEAVIEAANELADVESLLDWEYSVEAGTRKWLRRDDGREFTLEVDADGGARAQRKSASGRAYEIGEYTKSGITSREIRRFLGET